MVRWGRSGTWMAMALGLTLGCAGDGTDKSTEPPPPPPPVPTSDSTSPPPGPECGNGIVEGEEDCDDGVANADTAACTTACVAAACGDGLVWAGEEGCDDGVANADTAACTTACVAATCGDGLVWAGEEDCDDQNADDRDGCSTVCRAPVRLQLSGADLRLRGEEAFDHAGTSVSGAGDVNGDGFDDLIVGAPQRNIDPFWEYDVGAAYVVFGPAAGNFDLANADAILLGDNVEDYAGESVSGAGDVNGDGFDDVLVGAGRGEAVYLVLGPMAGTISLGAADATLTTGLDDSLGEAVSGAGDLDGDGFDDIVVGASGDDDGGVSAGAAYVLLGPIVGNVALANADAKLVGEIIADLAGEGVSGAGDVDGDGLADLLVGAALNDEAGNGAGAAYLLHGPVSGTVSLADAETKFVGEAADQAGRSVSGAGDVDGDGLDDFIISAAENSEGGNQAGAAYVVFDPAVGLVDLRYADGKLIGEGAHDQAGFSVSGAGDVDGDGFDDVIVGAEFDDGGANNAGAAYLVYGPTWGRIDLSVADVKLFGEGVWDLAGRAVSDAGDVDGDGLDDVLIGALDHDAGGRTESGSAYLVLGGL